MVARRLPLPNRNVKIQAETPAAVALARIEIAKSPEIIGIITMA